MYPYARILGPTIRINGYRKNHGGFREEILWRHDVGHGKARGTISVDQ